MPFYKSNFDTFCHGYSVIINTEKLDVFMEILCKKEPFPRLFELFDMDLDAMASCAGAAFSQDKITAMELTTLLSLRTLHQDALKIRYHQAIDNEGNITEELQKLVKSWFSIPQQADCFQLLKTLPPSEQYLFEVTLPTPNHARVEGLLNLAENLKLLKSSQVIEKKDDVIMYKTWTTFSKGLRDVFMQVRFGIHAKSIFPLPGIISIDEIDEFMCRGQRPISVAYPGIQNPKSFHGIIASQFYLSLHDEIHDVLISSIPNQVYYALLYAIHRIRMITNIHWSKEIWDSLDMDSFVFLKKQDNLYYKEFSYKEITRQFIKLMFTGLGTEALRPSGLFNASALNDTMWLLLLDLHFNQGIWKELFIDPIYLKKGSSYANYYDFIKLNQEQLKELAPAFQVAYIKSAWFRLPWNKEEFCTFNKIKKHNYIQVEQNRSPIFASKKDYFLIAQLETDVSNFHQASVFIKNIFIRHLLNDNFALISLINKENLSNFSGFINEIPDHREAVFSALQLALFNRPLYFFKHYSVSILIKAAVFAFPEKKDLLFQSFQESILKRYEAFHAFFNSFEAVYDYCHNIFPEETEALYDALNQHVFLNPQGLKKIFNQGNSPELFFIGLQTLFPDKKDRIFESMKLYKSNCLLQCSFFTKSNRQQGFGRSERLSASI